MRAPGDHGGPRQAVARLTLVVNLPVPLRITPAVLRWNVGEENRPKTVVLEAGEAGLPIAQIAATSSQALFQPKLRTLEAGRRCELEVTPARTDVPLSGQVPITCRFVTAAADGAAESDGKDLEKVFVIPVSVAPPATEKTAAPTRETR